MPVLWSRSSSAPPPASGSALVPAIALLFLSLWGILGCWQVRPFGVRLGAPIEHGLRILFGEDGVRPGRTLLEPVFFAAAAASVVWLLMLRRVLWPDPDSHQLGARDRLELTSDLKIVSGLTVVLIACAGASLVFLARFALGGPGSWLDDTLGPSPMPPLGLLALLAATAGIAWMLRHVFRRIKHHPRYGSEPRPSAE